MTKYFLKSNGWKHGGIYLCHNVDGFSEMYLNMVEGKIIPYMEDEGENLPAGDYGIEIYMWEVLDGIPTSIDFEYFTKVVNNFRLAMLLYFTIGRDTTPEWFVTTLHQYLIDNGVITTPYEDFVKLFNLEN